MARSTTLLCGCHSTPAVVKSCWPCAVQRMLHVLAGDIKEIRTAHGLPTTYASSNRKLKNQWFYLGVESGAIRGGINAAVYVHNCSHVDF